MTVHQLQQIVRTIAQLVSSDLVVQVDGVLWYGSRDFQGDIDLCIVFNGMIAQQRMNLGKLDILALNRKEFEFYVYHFDPIGIEPLFTGSIIVSNTPYLEKMRSYAKNLQATFSISSYLLRRSMEEYLNATVYFYQGQQVDSPFVFWVRSLVNLSFSWTYYLLSQYYRNCQGCPPAPITEVIEVVNDTQLAKLLAIVKKAKRQTIEISQEQVESWLRSFEFLFLAKNDKG